ncbi:DUF1294 domain-containing protein [Nitrincola tapanii]|uniref:DUF1294 domain-containing protein n=1 Tax=Nitrincola tapanii TaxID=1708751 RepID=A0A5A9W654_9GAMM|nr:DUF1294 domain-containing protein [Nitrincola tapanii]KAA0875021.1 DUF1294 domain-containing protein [Nitrincola tapanii]
MDKAAAQADRHRTPETILHIMALLGGWPGALFAQNFLRHKSMKVAFRTTFWWTVGLNLGLIGFLVKTTCQRVHDISFIRQKPVIDCT